MKRWGVHLCVLDSLCRGVGARRLYLFTPWGQLILAIGRDNWTQTWLPWSGHQQWYSPVVWQPR